MPPISFGKGPVPQRQRANGAESMTDEHRRGLPRSMHSYARVGGCGAETYHVVGRLDQLTTVAPLPIEDASKEVVNSQHAGDEITSWP